MKFSITPERKKAKKIERMFKIINKKYPYVDLRYLIDKKTDIFNIIHDQYTLNERFDISYTNNEFDDFVDKLAISLFGIEYKTFIKISFSELKTNPDKPNITKVEAYQIKCPYCKKSFISTNITKVLRWHRYHGGMKGCYYKPIYKKCYSCKHYNNVQEMCRIRSNTNYENAVIIHDLHCKDWKCKKSLEKYMDKE